ncbi:hypothetical protein QNH39_24975 [Neobacillus novalis]|uniref:Uncharacterized protein n=1 Tax=Neobacillus novalis TaxID=220687 RepID=A0AA95S8G6_9BACI|nr:hypothetical protein [Neobacillus novalis]WHY85815.1 hypothetical protein QNH39_24975 [Neobacillus novalis]
MVIQSNMSPKAIVEVWETTAPIFVKFNVPLADKTLESIVDSEIVPILLTELNAAVGSSTATCIEGG